MEQAKSFFYSLFQPTGRPSEEVPIPSGTSYRGTGATTNARRPTIVGQPYYRSPSNSIVVHRGLRNKSGENNCFLNAAVQVLWHTDVFRRSFRLCEGHTCVGDRCIFCSLKVIFTQYQYTQQSSIPPDILRNAMADCYKDQERFQLGLMDDAAECFEKLLEQMHFHLTGSDNLDSCSVSWCIPHAKFALTTVEQMSCGCGQSSEPHTFVEFVHYVSTEVIKSSYERLLQERITPHDELFDRSVHAAGALDQWRPCQNVKCTGHLQLKRLLLNSPDVVCIGLIWDSDVPSVSYIMSVMDSIGLKLHPKNIFDSVVSERVRDGEYYLTALITYYGRHYSTFCYHSRQQAWVYFDDARFKRVGSDWSDVKEECRRAHYQPLLLVYSNPLHQPLDTSNAPKTVTIHPGNKETTPPKPDTPTETTPTKDTPTNVTPTPISKVPDLMQFSITPTTTNTVKDNTQGHGLYPSLDDTPYYMNIGAGAVPSVRGERRPQSMYMYSTDSNTGANSTTAAGTNPFIDKPVPPLLPKRVTTPTTGHIPSIGNTFGTRNVPTAGTTPTTGATPTTRVTSIITPHIQHNITTPTTGATHTAGATPTTRVTPIVTPRTQHNITTPTAVITPSSFKQFEDEFTSLPHDIQLSLLTAGAYINQLPSTNNALITLSLVEQTTNQLTSVLHSTHTLSPSLRNTLTLKIQELERKARLLKQQKLQYPSVDKLRQLLSVSQSDKPPIAKKPDTAGGRGLSVTTPTPAVRTTSTGHSGHGSWLSGVCRGCSQRREVNSLTGLCNPCQLKLKIAK